MVRRRMVVSGRVQGVFFRETCRRVALEASVAGWVRNLTDGRVEAVFEGDSEAVAALDRWMRSGPRQARVIGVEVHDEDPQGIEGFRVLP